MENNLPNYFLLCFSAARANTSGHFQRIQPRAAEKQSRKEFGLFFYRHSTASGVGPFLISVGKPVFNSTTVALNTYLRCPRELPTVRGREAAPTWP